MRERLATPVALLSLFIFGGCATAKAGKLAPSVPAGSSSLASVESSDRRLAAALLAEAILPTAESHLQVGREYFRLGILDAAHTRTGRSLSRDPQFADAHELMARIWRDWGQPDSGLGHAHRAMAFAPRSASARNTLGTILDALGRTDEARQAYTAAIALDPGAGWALNNLCYLEFRLGRLLEARRYCEAALVVSPALRAAQNNLALAYAASGDMVEAAEAFRAAGDEAEAHYNVGIVHLAERRYAEAALAFERAIKARPAYTDAKKWAHDAHMRALTVDDRRP